MAENKNLLDSIIQAPGSLATRALQGIANTAANEQGITGDISRKVVGGLSSETTQGALEKATVPYKSGVARPLSAFLQTVKDAGKEGLSTREAWNRGWERASYISPGAAFVGATARLTPGKQGADKVNWSSTESVKNFFEKDNTSAERISGALDAVSTFFLDPLVLGGKAVKLTRLTAMGVRGTRVKGPLTFGASNVGKLSKELDAADAGESNAAAIVVDSIVNSKNDYTKLESIPVIANSSNPVAVARALSEAADIGGRSKVIQVMKAGIGDDAAIKAIEEEQSILSESLTQIKGEISSIKAQIKEIDAKGATLGDRPTLTSKQLKNLEASKEKLLAAKEEATKARTVAQKQLDASRTAVTPETEGGIVGKVGAELAWSRSKFIEYQRSKAAEVNGRGWFTDYDPLEDSLMSRAMHQAGTDAMSQTTFRVLRTVGYFGKGYKGREIPAGSVTIAGEVGDMANREFRARIIAGAKEAGYSAQTQKKFYNEFSALTTDSARFQYLEDFERKTLEATIKRKFESARDLTPKQIEMLDTTVRQMADDIIQGKAAQMTRIIKDQNYVHIDEKSGKEVIFKELQDSVNSLAARIAQREGVPMEDKHIKRAVDVISSTPLTRTQVPNVHYGVDFSRISEILSDDKALVNGIISVIRDNPDLNINHIADILKDAKVIGKAEGPGVVSGTKQMVSKAFDNEIKPFYESFQNYVWKPAVLLSLRYTSRNVLEGWGRVAASFADMGTHYGYSLSSMVSGFFDPSAIREPLTSLGQRTVARVERKGLLGTGGAQRAEANALAEKLENEVVIGRSFGIEKSDDAATVAEKIAKRYQDEGKHFFKESEDVLAASIEFASMGFKFFGTYRGNPATTALSRKVAKMGENIFSIKESDNVSTQFIDAIRSSDFEAAYRIAIDSDPKIIFNTLEVISSRAASASKQLEKLTAGIKLGNAPKLQAHIEQIDESLALIEKNADVTKMAFDSNNRIRIMADYNEALSVPRVAKEKIRAYSVKRVKISKNATIEAPMAKAMRFETTSSANSTARAVLGARRNTLSNMFAEGKKPTLINPSTTTKAIGDDAWYGAHSEYVNNILYGDDAGKFIIDMSLQTRSMDNPAVAAKVAKMRKSRKSKVEIDGYLASRYSDDEIKAALLNWIKSPASDMWRKEKLVDLMEYRNKGLTDAQWSDFTNTILGDVNKYVPAQGPSGEDLSFLRQALADGTFDETFSAKIPPGFRTSVYANAESRNVKFSVFYKNLVGNIFHMLATMPEDALVRHPFYNAVYKSEGERLAKQFAKQGVDVSTRTKEIQNAAHAMAHKAVIDRLYTVERNTNVGGMLKFLDPFYMAKQNTTKFWVGNAVRNPEVAVRYIQMFSMPYKLGEVRDRNDNYKLVNQVGHPWNTNGKVMIFEYPKWMVDNFFAGDSNARVEIPIAGFDVAFQGQPIGIPQIGSPVATFTLGAAIRATAGKPYDPALFLEKHGIADLQQVIKYVQPYYESTRGSNLAGQAISSVGTGSVAMENLLVGIGAMAGQFDNPANGQKFNARFRAIEADKLTRLAESGTPITGKIIEDTRNEALALATKSFFAEAFLSGLPIVTTARYRTQTELFSESRIRQLRTEFGYDLGTAMYTEEIDKAQGQYAVNLLTDSTVDNRYGFNSSEATLSGIYDNQELLNRLDKMAADSSLIGTLFNQGDFNADRSDVASDIMYNIKINGKPIKYTSDEAFTAAEDLQIRAASKEFYSGVEVIEQHARDHGIRKGTKAYDAYYGAWKDKWTAQVSNTYPLWNTRTMQIRQNRVDKNIFAAQFALSDPAYMDSVGSKNPMAQATMEYLKGRVKLQEELARAVARSGYTTVEAKDNAYVAELRDNYVAAIDKKYPGFQRVHDIYFNGDKLNDVSMYETGYGFGVNE